MERKDKVVVNACRVDHLDDGVCFDEEHTITLYSEGKYKRDWWGGVYMFDVIEMTELDIPHRDDKHVFEVKNGKHHTFPNGDSSEDIEYLSMSSEQLAKYQMYTGKIRTYGGSISNFNFFDNSKHININIENGLKVEVPSFYGSD